MMLQVTRSRVGTSHRSVCYEPSMFLRILKPLGWGSVVGLLLVACGSGKSSRDSSMNSTSSASGGSANSSMSNLPSGGSSLSPQGSGTGSATTIGSGSGGATVGSSSGGAPAVILPSGAITYYQHTAPVFAQKCVGCHQAGSIAPFSLTSYVEAKKMGPTLLPAIDSGAMPPWGAISTAECQPRLGFQNDRRLTDMEKALLHEWVRTGMLEGDPNTAAPLPPAVSLDLPNANTTVKIPTSASVSGNNDQFICFTLDPQLAQDVWLTGTQIDAGNKAIVHHVLVFDDPKGESVAKAAAGGGKYDCFGGVGVSGSLLAAWAPGATAAITPAEVGLPLKAGSRLVMQVHYHPTGAGVQVDSDTSVALRWVTTQPKYTGQLQLIGNFQRADANEAGGVGFGLLAGPNDPPGGPEFMIPAGVKDHTESQRFQLPGGAQAAALGAKYYLFGVGSHMHYVGRDMKIDVHRASPNATQPADECLLQTPSWDFNWQGAYFYDAPLLSLPTLSPGDVLGLRCTYDNTLSNPFLSAALDSQGLTAPREVRLGETTLDEMCLGIFGVAIESKFAALLP